MKFIPKICSICCILIFGLTVHAQSLNRDFPLRNGGTVEIINLFGRVEIVALEEVEDGENKVFLETETAESNLKIDASGGKIKIEAAPENEKARVDLILKVPERSRLKIETRAGEVKFSGNFESAEVYTDTGTIAADVPLYDVKYNLVWTQSSPRMLSDVELEKVKEKAAGKFVVKGKINQEKPEEKPVEEDEEKDKKKKKQSDRVELDLTTARGIILLNVSPNEVANNLRERPLTEAAKAIIRSGDSLLTTAIRRASPKYFGDYAKTLPPRKETPTLTVAESNQKNINAQFKQVLVKVTDSNNRAIGDLSEKDFEVLESGKEREILSVKPTTAPFNLVLVLDVSGSIENYVDFIRKAARNFIDTVSPEDKIAIVIFNEDVKVLSNFTTNKTKLSESLDTFDAGGGTAYYDTLAFTLADILRPLKGERTAIVTLTDGDDNRSFLPFDALLGSIQESGALIYPLYVPSSLIAASATAETNSRAIDPLRNRYIGLTTKAEGEGEKLAEISGGVYYPISRLSQLQTAYDDIVRQLRTAYTVTFRSDLPEQNNGKASPRLRVKVKRENSFVKLGSVIAVNQKDVSQIRDKTQSNFRFLSASFAPPPANSFKTLEITGEVETIKYKQFLGDKLKEFNIETNFDINKTQGAFLVNKLAVSRWTSPKRSRSYPYERVYDTLNYTGKKVAVIPVVKDEGLGGERDFIQWDTIQFLSLLDVHVVLAYYDDAENNPKGKDKITKQKYDNEFIKTKLNEIIESRETAREWNEREAKNLKSVFEKAKLAYQKIAEKTKTYLHDEAKLDELIKYAETPERFIGYSRRNSQDAQEREFVTIQPNEALATLSKGKITITNALYGKYYFTVDETKFDEKTIYLIEAKHTKRAKFPSKNDIKDGLIKMMLYTNLQNVKYGKTPLNYKVQIRLTSEKLEGSINSDDAMEKFDKFCADNLINTKDKAFLSKLFKEARENNFTVILEHGETTK